LAACDLPLPTLSAESFDKPAAQLARVDLAGEVQALVDAQAAAWGAKDAGAFAAVYADDATFFNPIGHVSHGRDEIRGAHEFLFGGPFAGTTETQEITAIRPLTGTIAIVHVDSDLTGYAQLLPGLVEAEPGVVRTKKTWVVEKRRGRWEIVTQHMALVIPAV
jgi:uncharacterized protein (TIGR02246 family)